MSHLLSKKIALSKNSLSKKKPNKQGRRKTQLVTPLKVQCVNVALRKYHSLKGGESITIENGQRTKYVR